MKLNVSVKTNVDLNKLLERAPQIGKKVYSAATKAIADRLAEEIVRKIPAGSGWLDIYRNSFRVRETADGWEVCGLCDVPLSQYPWDSSMISVLGDDPIASVLSSYNPWPIDLIPAIDGGYNATAVVTSRTTGEVQQRREYLVVIIDNVRDAVRAAGGTIVSNEAPVFNGQSFPDIQFLANRLEKGYGDFPHIPHISPAISLAQRDGVEWAAPAVQEALRSSFKGE